MFKFFKMHLKSAFGLSLLLFLIHLPLSAMVESDEEEEDQRNGEVRSRSSSSGSSTSTSSTDSLSLSMADTGLNDKIRAKNAIKEDLSSQFKDEDSLYLLAFDVGQANFILLKKGDILLIIDAGIETGRDLKSEIWDEFMKGSSRVKFVFITHPHSDHFNLMCDTNKLQAVYPSAFAGCMFYLSGQKGDWERTEECRGFVTGISESVRFYLQNQPLSLPTSTDQPFEINVFEAIPKATLPRERVSKKPLPKGMSLPENKENQLSPIIQVTFAGKKILFTGDAEGECLGRLFKRSASLPPFKWLCPDSDKAREIDSKMASLKSGIEKGEASVAPDYWKLYDELASCYGTQDSTKLYEAFAKENGWEVSDSIPLEVRREKLSRHLVNVLKIRRAFRSSDVVVLPHHGTTTEASQNFLGYFSPFASSCSKIYLVSSSPFGPHGLPKASTLEMAPRHPRVFEHPFLYCRDGLPKSMIQFTTTQKPIFLTGAAPAGFQAVKITKEEKLFILDPTNAETPWYEFNPQSTQPDKKHTRTD